MKMEFTYFDNEIWKSHVIKNKVYAILHNSNLELSFVYLLILHNL